MTYGKSTNEVLEKTMSTMRAIEWEKAKGHMQAMLCTFWPEYNGPTGERIDNGFDGVNAAVKKFIAEMDDLIC